jgi:purine-binding chemotaxis protein CheW
MHTATRRCCTFLVGDSCFAVDSTDVAEVLRGGALARVPLAPAAVVGLLHLRGRIVPVIDLAGQLGIPTSAAGRGDTHLVIRLQDEWYSLAVDEMLDVIEIPVDRIEHAVHAGEQSAHEMHVGVFAGPERLVHVIDPWQMIQSIGRSRGRTTGIQGASHGGQR